MSHVSLATLFKVSLEEIKEDLTGIPAEEPLESQLYYMEDAEEDIEGAHSDVNDLLATAQNLTDTLNVANEAIVIGKPELATKFLKTSLDAAYRGFGLEGYDGEVSVESVGDNIKAFLQSVAKAIKAAWEKVKDFFAMFFNAAKVVAAKSEQLIRRVKASNKKEFTVDGNFHGSVFKTSGTAIKALMAGMQHVAEGAKSPGSVYLKTADIDIGKLQLPYFLKQAGGRIVSDAPKDITAEKIVSVASVLETLNEIKSIATVATDLKQVVKTADSSIANLASLMINQAFYSREDNKNEVIRKLGDMGDELRKYQSAAVTVSKSTLHVANRQLNVIAKAA